MTDPRDFILAAENDDEFLTGSNTEFFPTDLINAERPRTKKERLADAVMDLVENDKDNGAYLATQSHMADLIWLDKELNGTLLSMVDKEFDRGVVKNRIQLIISALNKRILEVG